MEMHKGERNRCCFLYMTYWTTITPILQQFPTIKKQRKCSNYETFHDNSMTTLQHHQYHALWTSLLNQDFLEKHSLLGCLRQYRSPKSRWVGRVNLSKNQWRSILPSWPTYWGWKQPICKQMDYITKMSNRPHHHVLANAFPEYPNFATELVGRGFTGKSNIYIVLWK